MRSNAERKARLSVVRKIDLFYAGGSELEACKEEFLPKKLGEERAAYLVRLTRAVYDNVMGDEMRNFCDRLLTATVEFAPPTESVQRWTDSFDGMDSTVLEWLGEVFLLYLRHGLLWVFVDSDRLPDEIQETVVNIAQAERVRAALTPRALVLDVTNTLKWQAEGHAVKWLEYYWIEEIVDPANPGAEPKKYCRWVWVDDESIATYGSFVHCDKYGVPSEAIGGLADGKVPLEAPPIRHQRSQTPVVQVKAKDPVEWVGDQVVKLAHMAYDLSSLSWDTASLVGDVARTWKPYTPKDDPSMPAAPEPPTKSGWTVADQVNYGEFEGSSVRTLDEKVSGAEERIRQTITNVGVASASREAMEQSGLSKQVDDDRSQLALLGYGEKMLNLLQMVADLGSDIVGGEIAVTGLDKFDLANADRILDRVERMNKPDIRDRIPSGLHMLQMKELSVAIAKTASDDVRQRIEGEIDALYPEGQQPPEPLDMAG